MSDDILKDYPVDQVHRWYNRLADAALARIQLSGTEEEQDFLTSL